MIRLYLPRTFVVRFFAAMLFLACAWVAYTQNPQQAKQARQALNLIKITDDLYMIEGPGGNVAFYVTDEGVILIDDKFDQDYDGIMAKIKSVTARPVKYLLNTHHHGDHTGSNPRFESSAEIISHVNSRINHVQLKQPGAPRVVFTQETDIFLGGKEVRAIYFGRGHTNGDVMVYFPALRVIHTGDLMAGNSPLIDYEAGGSLLDWAKTLDGALKLDFETVIQGHGPLAKKADLLKYRNDVETFRTRITGLVRGGKSKDDVAKFLIAEYAWAPNGLPMQRSLNGLMTELK
jgi:glyoxylase-like metal-dependent hydrolase (beta-lactamase superfamily II)